MIIAVDYDGTLQLADGSINMALIRRLTASQRRGDVVILWTCREGRRLEEAVQKLARHGWRPSLVNSNAPQTVRILGYDPRKILADIYIDDKSIR